MKELTIKPFKIDDLSLLGLTDAELNIYEAVEFTEPCWTVFYKTEIVFCGGVQEIMPNVGEAWLMYSVKGRNYINSFKTAKDLLHQAKRRFKRIQATADPVNKAYSRFLEHLGFTYEGTLRKYGVNGQDMRMYSIVQEDE